MTVFTCLQAWWKRYKRHRLSWTFLCLLLTSLLSAALFLFYQQVKEPERVNMIGHSPSMAEMINEIRYLEMTQAPQEQFDRVLQNYGIQEIPRQWKTVVLPSLLLWYMFSLCLFLMMKKTKRHLTLRWSLRFFFCRLIYHLLVSLWLLLGIFPWIYLAARLRSARWLVSCQQYWIIKSFSHSRHIQKWYFSFFFAYFSFMAMIVLVSIALGGIWLFITLPWLFCSSACIYEELLEKH